jgi:hypothetical protein
MNNGHKFTCHVAAVRDESKLTYQEIANTMEVTLGAVMKWKSKGATIEGLVLLLKFAADNELPVARKLAKTLQDACGSKVKVFIR